MGTEIIIIDSGFGTAKRKVLLESIGLTVLKWKDTWIWGRLAKPLSPGTYDITIEPKGAEAVVFEDGFIVKTPEIKFVDPASGSAADQITLNGFFFGSKKGKVTLGGKNCRVLRWTMVPTTGESLIRFIVPKGLAPGSNALEVKNGVGSVITNFTVE